jgi:hypothetical protein
VNLDVLLSELRTAFSPSPISAVGAFTQRGITYPDGDEYSMALDTKPWHQLEPDFFTRRSDALYFLSDSHLALVLPLYLHLLLTTPPWSPVSEALMSLLTRPEPTDEPIRLFSWRIRRFEGLTQLLTDEQKQTVARVLEHFAASTTYQLETTALALERYWRAFA